MDIAVAAGANQIEQVDWSVATSWKLRRTLPRSNARGKLQNKLRLSQA
jgi:uncharacterized protein YggE